MDGIYITFRMGTVGNGKIVPYKQKYDVNGAEYRRHYQVLWYGKQLPEHPLRKRITAFIHKQTLPASRLIVDVTVKNCTDELKNKLLSCGDVQIIDTPEKWRF